MHLPRLVVAVDVSNYLYRKFVDPLVDDSVAWAEGDEQATRVINKIRTAHHEGNKDEKGAAQTELRVLLGAYLGSKLNSLAQPFQEDFQDPRILLTRLLTWLRAPENTRLSTDPLVQSLLELKDGLQREHVGLILCSDNGKTPHQVTIKRAMQLAEQFSVDLQEFGSLQDMASVQQQQHAEQGTQQLVKAAPSDAASSQMDAKFCIQGALLHLAKGFIMQQGRRTANVREVSADTFIAAVAAQVNQLKLPCIVVSDDTDFWQLKPYNILQASLSWPDPGAAAAADMDKDYLKKCALIGKGYVLRSGSVFGPIPAGMPYTDAAGTAVTGTAVTGTAELEDPSYPAHFQAFTDALLSKQPWLLSVEQILEWLQQYQQQVPDIRARFLINMVHHCIDPSSIWSPMSEELKRKVGQVSYGMVQQALGNPASAGRGKGSRGDGRGSPGGGRGSPGGGSGGGGGRGSSGGRTGEGNGGVGLRFAPYVLVEK